MDNSGDYISREAVVSSLNRLCDRVCQYSKAQRNVMCGACPLGDAFTVIEDDIPAADVRPVVRGRWIRKAAQKSFGEDDFTCSECGTYPWWCGVTEEILPKFCPTCGADMSPEVSECD